MKRFELIMIVLVALHGSGCPAESNGPGADSRDEGAESDGIDVTEDTADVEEIGDAEDEAVVEPLPFGLPSAHDDATYVGVSEVDITPVIVETFADLNENGHFDGCPDDPSASEAGCDEPFDDVDGDGEFDAVWIAGFDPKRAALEVHDPLSVRTMVLVRNGEYIFLIGMDLIGLPQGRIDQAREILQTEDGMAPERFVAASAHNHEGPDVFGVWGFTDVDAGVFNSGFDANYQERVVAALVESVRDAAADVRPAEVLMGMEDMAARSPWFNGRHFGGTNPQDHQHGLINDIRDPILASTRVFAMHARDPETGAGIATWLNFSSHPEVWGDRNNAISADWVGVARNRIDAALGGLTVFMPECLGGMQSMLGAAIPQVDEEGAWMWQAGPDSEPVWAPGGSWEVVRSAGTHVADAALDAVAGAELVTLDPFVVRWNTVRIHIDNQAWSLGASLGLVDVDLAELTTDPLECPEIDVGNPLALGCWNSSTWRLRLGPLAVITAPGELLPEVFHGLPDDPRWAAESEDASLRGTDGDRDSRYFPQHPPECDAVAYDDCRNTYEVGDCNCLRMHDVPYDVSPDPASLPPLVTLLSEDATYRVATSATGNYMSYIIPENDFHRSVSLLSGPVGDHYEETVSPSSTAASALVRAQLELGDESE